MKRVLISGILAIIMMFSALVINNPVQGARDVNFNLTASDATGDVQAVNPEGTMVEDTDITYVSSSSDGTNIIFILTVSGTIHLSVDMSSSIYYGYSFEMDVDDDGVEDWKLDIAAMPFTTQIELDEQNGDLSYTSGISVEGDGTNTLTVSFPLSYLTAGSVSITSWAFNAATNAVDQQTQAATHDFVPDDQGFITESSTGDNSDNDNTGNDTSGDNNNTSGSVDTSIQINILKPAGGETIVVTSPYQTYTCEGTVSVPSDKTVDNVQWMIENMDSDWNDATDNSSSGDWSSWIISLPVGAIYGYLTTPLTVTMDVKATLTNGDYNTASVTFTLTSSSSGGTSDDDGSDTNNTGENNTGSDSEGSSSGSSSGTSEGSSDPGTETPTDTSIDVKITEVTGSYKDNGDGTYTIEFTVKGTTSGVDHCKITFVNYYTDGSHDDEVYWMSEGDLSENPYMKAAGYQEFYFKSTSDNWKTWEFHVKGTFKNTESSNGEGKELKFSRIYVRAFADAGENQWNQAYKDFYPSDVNTGGSTSGSSSSSGTSDTSGTSGTSGSSGTSNTGGSNETSSSSGKTKSSTPGFEVYVVFVGVMAAIVIAMRRRDF